MDEFGITTLVISVGFLIFAIWVKPIDILPIDKSRGF